MKSTAGILPRAMARVVESRLRSFPVVVLTGARQTGKSTLARSLLKGPSRAYRTLDDIELLDRARNDPDALLDSRMPITLDEIQRSPDLLLAVKRAVDRDRSPGAFLLTGSANLALLGKVSETLAGRAVYSVLSPLTLAEKRGLGRIGAWDTLLRDPGVLEGPHPPFAGWIEEALIGGLPPSVLAASEEVRGAWFDGHVRSYLERDLQMLSRIDRLADFRRLLRVAALRTGRMMNQIDMARDAGLSQATAHRYLNLAEASYLFCRLPAYGVNRTKRLMKTPRLFALDTALAAHLAGVRSVAAVRRAGMEGPLLETMVLTELRAWRETCSSSAEILYWRTASGEEVDFVIETPETILPVEIKAGPRVRAVDARHIRSFIEEYSDICPHGIVLHTGRQAERIAERLWAVPISAAFACVPNAPATPS